MGLCILCVWIILLLHMNIGLPFLWTCTSLSAVLWIIRFLCYRKRPQEKSQYSCLSLCVFYWESAPFSFKSNRPRNFMFQQVWKCSKGQWAGLVSVCPAASCWGSTSQQRVQDQQEPFPCCPLKNRLGRTLRTGSGALDRLFCTYSPVFLVIAPLLQRLQEHRLTAPSVSGYPLPLQSAGKT